MSGREAVLREILGGKDSTVNLFEKGVDVENDPTLFGEFVVSKEEDFRSRAQRLG